MRVSLGTTSSLGNLWVGHRVWWNKCGYLGKLMLETMHYKNTTPFDYLCKIFMSSTVCKGNAKPFLIIYYFFQLCPCTSQKNGWHLVQIIKIFYSNPCSRPLLNKGHIPIQIFSQEKTLGDILLGQWKIEINSKRMEGRNQKGRKKSHQMLLLAFWPQSSLAKTAL